MFIARVRSSGKNGKFYESVLLRESVRIGSKVSSRTLAVLTKLPKWLISTIETAIKGRGDGPQLADGATSPGEVVTALQFSAGSPVSIHQGESFGALWLVKSLADKLGIAKALAPANCPEAERKACDRDFSEIALWRVCARVLVPGISLLGTTRLASQSAALRLFSWHNPWCEDDLYQYHGAWLDSRQNVIEKSLWQTRCSRFKPSSDDTSDNDLFLYDVTSSYFEGTTNALSAFGYNRDGKKGKMQVVMGLLTDSNGDPCAIKVYSGETRDFATFGDALHQARNQFGCRHVVMVGDRGMIKSEQIQAIKESNGHYISSLTKPQIERLLKEDVLQIELFDEKLAEVTDKATKERYVLRRNPVRREEMRANRSERRVTFEKHLQKANRYLQEHPRAKVAVQCKHLQEHLRKLRIQRWLSVEEDTEKRSIKIVIDEERLHEEEKLDGCYAIRTNLNESECSMGRVHERYKTLSEVEADFRTMKTGHLEVRPFFVMKEENTRAHALTAMLALKVRRYLAEAWKTENLTVEEGLRQLEALSILRVEDGTDRHHELLPQPSPLQARLLKLAKVTLPKEVPTAHAAPVVTRKQLPEERKSA